ncbi:MAG TPA: SDR family oxidoreductase [Gemmatimonadaceae bacterium]|jgi:NAD(P)-dependent dehydrogenase (short-subunit alcohol dehydrogenase family)|nr:SDR family oxidoreductase [Gemmatimonadaceae bacterium]
MNSSTGLFAISGRVAIVTGAARGLGRRLAHGLAEHGASVAVCDINVDGANATTAAIQKVGGHATCARVDVTDAASCEELVRHAVSTFGRVDVLVNDAAIDIVESFESITDEAWKRVVDVDLKGVMHMSRAVVRHMLERGGGGSIINISSIASAIAIPGLGAYSAAKGGVNQLTRVMAVDLAAHGIRVNAIAPGYLENIMEGLGGEHAKPETEKRIEIRTPMRRRARLDELVGPVVFLASDAASYVTGAVLFVDGGYTAA